MESTWVGVLTLPANPRSDSTVTMQCGCTAESQCQQIHRLFLARDAFVRMNHRAIAMMFARPSVCGTGVHCDHTVHVSTDLSLWLDSLMFWASRHQSTSTYSQPSFSSSTCKRGGVWICKLGKALNANNDK